MQFLGYNENKQRGTYDFPFEFYHVNQNHPQYIMSYHWHVEYEILRVVSGELRVTMDEKTIEAKSGDVIFINSGVLHSAMPAACVYECIVFDLDTLLQISSVCKKKIESIRDHSVLVYDFFRPEKKDVHSAVWDIFNAMKECRPGYELSVYGLFYRFFGLIYENHYYLENEQKTRRDYKRLTQMRSVLNLIESQYDQPLTLSMMAAAAGMSSKYFCRFFAVMTHRKPMDYLNHYRIERACYELSSSDATVTDVAYSCGFNDLSYFIKTFKKYKGMTPGSYVRRAS